MKQTRRNHGQGADGLGHVQGRPAVGGVGDTIWRTSQKSPSDAPDLKVLHAKIGQLALENEFLEGALINAGWLNATR